MSGFGTKLTVPAMMPGYSTSESIVLDKTGGIETVEQPVEEFNLMSVSEMKKQIAIGKEFHKRPMSDLEYNHLVSLLQNQKDATGNLLYKHDLAAIARVIKENFEKFFPSLSLDYNVSNSLEFHQEVDHILIDMYDEAVNKYRQPFSTTTAEEVKSNYTPDEIVRLRNLGVAFTTGKYAVYDTVETLLVESGDISRDSFVKRSFQHPLLKYNLLKGKNESIK